jgi:hypothetical protein
MKRDKKGQTFPELFKAFDAQNLDATFSWPSSESLAMAQNWNANRPRKWFILGIEARNFINFWGFPKCSDPRALVNPLSTLFPIQKKMAIPYTHFQPPFLSSSSSPPFRCLLRLRGIPSDNLCWIAGKVHIWTNLQKYCDKILKLIGGKHPTTILLLVQDFAFPSTSLFYVYRYDVPVPDSIAKRFFPRDLNTHIPPSRVECVELFRREAWIQWMGFIGLIHMKQPLDHGCKMSKPVDAADQQISQAIMFNVFKVGSGSTPSSW